MFLTSCIFPTLSLMYPHPRQKTSFTSFSVGPVAHFTSPHRFTFNGQERTDEIAGTGNHTTALFWEYDTRLGRRWNVDPVVKQSLSGYSAFANNPIFLKDHNGDDTLKINGSNNSQMTVSYGTGTAVSNFNLCDYNIDLDIGKRSIDLGNTPDVIGLDLGTSGSVPLVSAGVGVNLLWHLRGEKSGDKWYPELHTYTSGGAVASKNVADLNGTLGVSFFWGWAETRNPTTGKIEPASNSWVANGYNWTGTFYTGNVSIGAAWQITGSKFTSLTPGTQLAKGESMWSGYSLGVSWGKSSGGPLKVKNFMDILKNSSASFQSQYFWLMYGNGSDHLPKSKKNVSGWNILNPIDPEDDK
jgi:hypothetical protein